MQSQQSHFATLLKSHQHTEMPSKIRSTSTEYPPSGETLWGTASACQKNLQKVVKRNLLTLKMNK